MKQESSSNVQDELFRHDHVTVIEPYGSVFGLKLKELWAYKDLILIFIRRDFVTQFKQTVLGPLWHIIQPLLTTVVFTIVFGNIAELSTDGSPAFLFYFAGNVLWAYFSNVFMSTSSTFTFNAPLFSKVYFPRLAIPASLLFSKLISFGIQFTFFLFVLGYYTFTNDAVSPNAWVLISPLLVMMMAAMGLSGGIIMSALTSRYRDLAVITTFGVQLLMYGSSIIFPVSEYPEKWQFWVMLNPIVPVVETFRYAFLGQGTLNLVMLFVSFMVNLVVLYFGIVLFNYIERTVIDTV